MTSSQRSIQLFNETSSTLPIDSSILQSLVRLVEEGENGTFKMLEVAMVSKSRIKQINRAYLDHDFITDIITFRYDENEKFRDIEGTLFCCWGRIREQATEYDATPRQELIRVVLHGLLHLSGYKDKTDKDRSIMRERENYYLNKFNDS